MAGDKIYCLHETDDAETVREHARRGGFPADVVVTAAAGSGPRPRTPDRGHLHGDVWVCTQTAVVATVEDRFAALDLL